MFIGQGIEETEQGVEILLDVDGQPVRMTVPVAKLVRRVLGRLIGEVECGYSSPRDFQEREQVRTS